MTLALLLVLFELWLLLCLRRRDWRRALVEAVVVWSILLLTVSEGLSAVRAFAQVPLFVAWTTIALALLWPLGRASSQLRALARQLELGSWRAALVWLALLLPIALTLVVAVVAPPNTTDSLTYHMGRVVAWLDQRSIAHFATHVERQVALSPFAELVIANLQGLSGGDRFANLVQWFAFVLSATTASLLVREMGADRRAQTLAAIVVVTTPMAILQATSTQNDLVCAFFVSASAFFCLSLQDDPVSALALGAAAGLALLTKGTATVFLAPFAIWAVVRLARTCRPRRGLAMAGLAAAVALAIHAPQWGRNQRVFGDPLGPSWITRMVGNEVHGLGPTYSNLIRNSVSHIGLLEVRMRAPVLAVVSGLHGIVGLDMDDPRTNLLGKYSTSDISRHEDAAPNTVQLLLFLVSGIVILLRSQGQQRWLWLAVLGGFVLYAAMFKWQPWGSRLHTPFFVLAAVPTALALQTVLGRISTSAAVVALVVCAAPWLLANVTRSLLPPALQPRLLQGSDIWTKPRMEQYFANRPAEHGAFATLAQRLHASGCADVGVLGDEDSWTYPLHVLLRQRGDRTSLRPVMVANATAALTRPGPEPCALVSLAFDRSRGPEHGALARFRPVWHDGELGLYLPEVAPSP